MPERPHRRHLLRHTAGRERAGSPYFPLALNTDNPYKYPMQTVIQTPTFLADAKSAGVADDELAVIAATIAADPQAGDVIPGTGGARKVRFPAPGRGKSGGYRVITFYAPDDVPVFLLALVSKGQRADISQADRNALRAILGTLADDYRRSVTTRVRPIRNRKPPGA